MPFRKKDQTILADLKKAKSIFRDLEEVLVFYERLFQVQFAFKDQRRVARGPDTGRKGKSIFKLWRPDCRKSVSRNWACGRPPMGSLSRHRQIIDPLYRLPLRPQHRTVSREDHRKCAGDFCRPRPAGYFRCFGYHRQDRQRTGIGSFSAAGLRTDSAPDPSGLMA